MDKVDKVCFEQVTVKRAAAVQKLSQLASRIVKEHYDPIIGPDQNDYMIEMFQSEAAIKE